MELDELRELIIEESTVQDVIQSIFFSWPVRQSLVARRLVIAVWLFILGQFDLGKGGWEEIEVTNLLEFFIKGFKGQKRGW
ncbi:hypothetical protein IT084_16885 [Desulfallas sp. Bu1-1]|uniref:hypothetical protein n=1 Tax=Desulfallas sp. Bu1-1 TaxID=2787620 RepID=UPI00189EF8A4|nr:hypothetical protein [Desulfallas sp. Bu1-1]MBF7084616.1 hypothetical protein [Desulfallas sp. Bu1-1]